jgi:type IV pilus secretin PilQ/predicted competence protein
LKSALGVTHKTTGSNHAVVIAIQSKSAQVSEAPVVKSGAEASKLPLTEIKKEVAPQQIAFQPSPPKSSILRLDEEVVVSGSSSRQKTLAVLEASVHPEPSQVKASADNKPELIPPPLKAKTENAVVVPGVKDPSVVESVALDGQEKSPSVVVGVKGAATYSIDRTAPSEYVLTLRNAIAQDAILKQTLFTSKESSGIRSVRTTRDGDNTLVRIFTQPSSYLTARRNGDRLIIQETQDLALIARDIRAQMDPVTAKGAQDSPVQKDQPEKKEPAKAGPQVAAQQSLPPETTKKVEEVAAKRPDAPKKESEPAVAPSKPAAPAQRAEGELAAIRGSSLTYTGRLISLDLQDADIDSALRIIAEVSNLNIVAGDGVVGKVTLKLVDVPWDQALDVILKNHGLDKVLEGNVLRVAAVDKLKQERESFKQARVAEEELEPLSVKYMRISYAKASEIKALVETVLTERGTVAFDERSNQLVVKDVRKGLQNVAELIRKVDLRTPQILLETQIIEASRNLSRQLGSELGFQYIQSPATGNGTGLNFPSAIAVGGSADTTNPNNILGSAFPITTSAISGSAVTMLFDSADGTKSLALRLSQLEQEGQVRIISKPAVATTNNKPAEIKSVEKYRVKLPNGGLSIATGSGAQSTGAGNVATQTIEAGIVLNVTPQASPDYYILLDIQAKSSSFGSKSVEGIPNEIERSASSSVLVSSGQTFALGGIYKITERDSVSGVPFFKDIPVLGTFFRSATTENSDEELLFFITPRIVEGSFEDAGAKVVS